MLRWEIVEKKKSSLPQSTVSHFFVVSVSCPRFYPVISIEKRLGMLMLISPPLPPPHPPPPSPLLLHKERSWGSISSILPLCSSSSASLEGRVGGLYDSGWADADVLRFRMGGWGSGERVRGQRGRDHGQAREATGRTPAVFVLLTLLPLSPSAFQAVASHSCSVLIWEPAPPYQERGPEWGRNRRTLWLYPLMPSCGHTVIQYGGPGEPGTCSLSY